MTVRLRTARLDLTPFGTSDLDHFHALSVQPGVRRYLWDDEAISLDRARETLEANERLWAERGFGLFALRVREHVEPIGYAGLWEMPGRAVAELLYALGMDWWHRGYATEASLAIMQDAVSRLGHPKIVASTDAPNEASIRVLHRLGMTPVRRGVAAGLDIVFFEIAATDVLSDPASSP
ncbi:MAG: hypothetical protein MNPFHGCM_00216 [Gemmatimonadaceae bacterium]|nr:hypothetical protein [Gemmatimonadaceae bacterium]